MLLVTVLGTRGLGLAENAGAVTSELSERRDDVGHRVLADLLVGKLGFEFDVAEDGVNAADGHVIDALARQNVATPPVWDSTLCMKDWRVPHFQHEPDPNGYIIYVNGRCFSALLGFESVTATMTTRRMIKAAIYIFTVVSICVSIAHGCPMSSLRLPLVLSAPSTPGSSLEATST